MSALPQSALSRLPPQLLFGSFAFVLGSFPLSERLPLEIVCFVPVLVYPECPSPQVCARGLMFLSSLGLDFYSFSSFSARSRVLHTGAPFPVFLGPRWSVHSGIVPEGSVVSRPKICLVVVCCCFLFSWRR